MSGANPWLQRQRKSDLVELAEVVGLKGYETQKKADLEVTLDEYLSENSSQFSSEPKLAPYYNNRAKAAGSPVKRESLKEEAEKGLKVAKRRATRVVDEIVADGTEENTSTALARTPGRALSLASRIPLPATPADVANAVDRGTLAVRQRVSSLYQESGITEGTQAVRESLSTVTSVLFTISVFELYFLRPELLPGRYAFTIPAVPLLGTGYYPVYLPDMFLLLTASFWSPATLWTLTSLVIPSLFGYFYNLSAASQPVGRGRPKANQPDYTVDPLTFSIVKALISYVIYAQGVTLGGAVNPDSVERINSAIYGGWKGVLTGTAITALVSVYDAVLRK